MNFNRQPGATVATIGRPKAEVMAEMARAVNPHLEITVVAEVVTRSNVEAFLADAEIVLDGIDFFNPTDRRDLYNTARDRGLYVVSFGPIGFSAVLQVWAPTGPTFDEYYDLRPDMGYEDQLVSFVGVAPGGTHLAYIGKSKVDLEGKWPFFGTGGADGGGPGHGAGGEEPNRAGTGSSYSVLFPGRRLYSTGQAGILALGESSPCLEGQALVRPTPVGQGTPGGLARGGEMTTFEHIDDEEVEILVLFLRGLAERYLVLQIGLVRDADDITKREFQALELIALRGADTVSRIAELGDVPLSTASWIASQLVEKGYLTREPDPHDRRVQRLRLAAKGRRIIDTLEQTFRQVAVDLYAMATEEERRTLLRLAERFLARDVGETFAAAG